MKNIVSAGGRVAVRCVHTLLIFKYFDMAWNANVGFRE